MEQPPGSIDELQPQDLSTSGSPIVIDLTRKGEERVLTSTSLDALRAVKSPSWYPSSETGSSDTTLQSVDPVQPDNAFSHTTVTLSYVSRSHVFPTLDSLSRHSPLYGVPPKLSLHPPCDKGLVETGYALNQHYLEQVDGPVDLARDSNLFQSQAQERREDDRAHRTKESQEVVDGVASSTEKGEEEKALGNSLSPETLSSATGEDEEGSEELSPTSKKRDLAIVPVTVRDLCSPSWEYISPLEDPVSPSATSLDNVDDVFILPQASCSPSGDNAYLETFEEVAWDGLGTQGPVQPVSSITTTVFDSSAENKPSVHGGKAAAETLVDLTDDVSVSDVPESKQTFTPHVNGNARAPQRTLNSKKLPLESGGETGLETTIIINSNRYKVSGSMRTNKKTNGGTRNDGLSERRRTTRARAPSSATTAKQKAAISTNSGSDVHSDSCNHSTSDSEISNSKTVNGTPRSVQKKSKKELSSPDVHTPTCPPPSKSPKKRQSKGTAPGSKKRPSAKTRGAGPPRRRQKKIWSPPTSMFSPKEPEIKLKYVNYKEEKRTLRLDGFSPFVHVERQPSSSSLCTLVNYPDQVRTQPKKGPQPKAQPSDFLSAVIPSTSCLQLGRVSMHSQHRRALVCCLCGLAANAMDLGDLHGPYYPEGFQPSAQRPASVSGLKEGEEDSGSDSSGSCIRGRGRKCRPASTSRPLRQNGLPEGYRWTADKSRSPAAKRARLATGSADLEDWYSPPMLPLEPCEYWLHEDCGIWSAGVFLVNGKVYGLEEAVKVAQETVCSACSNPGATLGCFFKGCLNKYHYRCALKADCVLIEENFSMKCKKHKNKTFKSPGTRRDDR